jgi:molybdenum cofactor cytidylyltransferase
VCALSVRLDLSGKAAAQGGGMVPGVKVPSTRRSEETPGSPIVARDEPGGEAVPAAALVLAAGGSRRLGRPKQLVDWDGRPLLEHVVAAVAAWPVGPVVVVLGAYAEEILDRVRLGAATAVINPEWEEGIASSLRVGLDLLTRETREEAAFIVLGDQPRIPAEVPPALLAAFEAHGRPAVVPVYRYQRGNPIVVGRSLWPRLMSLQGDTGAAALLRAHAAWVEEVHFDCPAPGDVDTRTDLRDDPRGV